MSVNTTHEEYDLFLGQWRTLRDAYEGSDAIRSGGERYLPRPSGMKLTKQWEAYLNRPEWFNATRRTIHGLTGAVFRKEPAINGVELWTESPTQVDITGTGVTLANFLRQLFQEIIHMGRFGMLLDIGAEETAEPQPVWSGYHAEHIINWRTETRGTDEILTLVVLREFDEEDDPDSFITVAGSTDGSPSESLAFGTDVLERLRVLWIDSEGFYRVDRWELREGEKGSEATFTHIETFIPTRQGQRLDFIPFIFVNTYDLETKIRESPALDLVRINLRHWRHQADYEHGLHFSGLPTVWITGHTQETQRYNESGKIEEEDVMTVGSGEAIVLPEADAKIGLLSLADAEFGALKEALRIDKEEMAVLGARLLEDRPDINETATAVRMRHSGDESILKTSAKTASDAATLMLQWHMWWAGLSTEPTNADIALNLNTDFMSLRLSQQDIQALIALRQEGEISAETLYYNLEQGEISQPGVSFEAEQVRITNNPPRLPLIPGAETFLDEDDEDDDDEG